MISPNDTLLEEEEGTDEAQADLDEAEREEGAAGPANKDEVQVVSYTLQLYAEASGQCINLEKSSAYFSSNVSVEHKAWIVDKLKVKVVERFDSYLGLPTLIGRRKYDSFAFLKERVWKKMQGWKGKLLSRAGKEILIKVVAQSIPTYTMGVFQLPGKLCDELDAMCARFWWGQVPLSRRVMQDSLVWLFTKNGRYSVNSGYHVAKQWRMAENSSGEALGHRASTSLWSWVWKARVPNKDNLVQRRVMDDASCYFCHRATETTDGSWSYAKAVIRGEGFILRDLLANLAAEEHGFQVKHGNLRKVSSLS
ncbi:uncharacterized protein LOC142616311 [Castanea sativa]|uniref:uncharacterized protein LOC142616311 n=1 Tax=Castanea sativa TaxID=21020 RepID=UPI003F649DF1